MPPRELSPTEQVLEQIRVRAEAFERAGLGTNLRVLVGAEMLKGVIEAFGFGARSCSFPLFRTAPSSTPATHLLALNVEIEKTSSPDLIRVLPAPEHVGKRPDLEAPLAGGRYANGTHPWCMTCQRPVERFNVDRNPARRETSIASWCHGDRVITVISDLVLAQARVNPRPNVFPAALLCGARWPHEDEDGPRPCDNAQGHKGPHTHEPSESRWEQWAYNHDGTSTGKGPPELAHHPAVDWHIRVLGAAHDATTCERCAADERKAAKAARIAKLNDGLAKVYGEKAVQFALDGQGRVVPIAGVPGACWNKPLTDAMTDVMVPFGAIGGTGFDPPPTIVRASEAARLPVAPAICDYVIDPPVPLPRRGAGQVQTTYGLEKSGSTIKPADPVGRCNACHATFTAYIPVTCPTCRRPATVRLRASEPVKVERVRGGRDVKVYCQGEDD